MEQLNGQILAQWGFGALIGLAMSAAFLKAFFALMADNRAIRQELVQKHLEREERFFLGLLDCVNKNTAILEQVESSLRKIIETLSEMGGREE